MDYPADGPTNQHTNKLTRVKTLPPWWFQHIGSLQKCPMPTFILATGLQQTELSVCRLQSRLPHAQCVLLKMMRDTEWKTESEIQQLDCRAERWPINVSFQRKRSWYCFSDSTLLGLLLGQKVSFLTEKVKKLTLIWKYNHTELGFFVFKCFFSIITGAYSVFKYLLLLAFAVLFVILFTLLLIAALTRKNIKSRSIRVEEKYRRTIMIFSWTDEAALPQVSVNFACLVTSFFFFFFSQRRN